METFTIILVGTIIVLAFFLMIFRQNSKMDDKIHKKDFDEINHLKNELKFERMAAEELIEKKNELEKEVDFLRKRLLGKDED